MARNSSSYSGSGWAVFLIALGIFFLLVNFIHGVSFWWTFFRYWPVILILLGLGYLWDYLWRRKHPDPTERKPVSGVLMAWVLVVVIFSILLVGSRGHTWGVAAGPTRHD